MEEDEPIELKIITLGNSQVGKTSIINRFTSNYFDKDLINTIGIDSKTHQMKIEEKTINLKIWDSAGQERFRSIQKHYYNQVDGILFVYDITKEDSFKIIESWFDEVKTKAINTLCGVLIGNKSDLEGKRVISYEEGKNFADENNLLFFETSAKNGSNIQECFNQSASILVDKIEKGQLKLDQASNGIQIGNFPDSEQNENLRKKKKKCC